MGAGALQCRRSDVHQLLAEPDTIENLLWDNVWSGYKRSIFVLPETPEFTNRINCISPQLLLVKSF